MTPHTDQQFIDQDIDAKYIRMLEMRPKDFKLYMPPASKLMYEISEARAMFYQTFKLRPNYFIVRHRLNIDGKRALDTAFLIHYVHDHLSPKKHGSLMERLRYYRFWYFGYGTELNKSMKLTNKKKKTKKEAEFIDLYNRIHWFMYLEYKENDMLEDFHSTNKQL